MDLKTLERAKILSACIDSINNNIENISQFKECSEIMIVANTSKAQEAIKGIYHDRKTGNLPPIYYSGKNKNAIIDSVIERYKEFLNEKLKELEQL